MATVCKKSFATDEEMRAGCDSQAQSMTGLTAAFGGSFHARSQAGDRENGIPGACDCYPGEKAADDRWLERFTEFYMAHSEPEMSQDEAAAKAGEVLLKHGRAKRGEAYYKMIKKYQKSTVETEFVWDNVKAEL
jgi:hypothetical protein